MASTSDQALAERRRHMVEHDIAGRRVTDAAVLAAMGRVRRECFVPDRLVASAYDDRPLPIEASQTISQPYIVAAMTAAAELTAESRVLEIGTGSGYGAAVLAEIAAEVWSIERHAVLAHSARERLARLGYTQVHVVEGDGTLGLPDAAPFDAIVVTAGAPVVPDALVEQLIDGGRLVIPVGDGWHGQELVCFRRQGSELVEERLGAVRFVPLIGAGLPGTDRRRR